MIEKEVFKKLYPNLLKVVDEIWAGNCLSIGAEVSDTFNIPARWEPFLYDLENQAAKLAGDDTIEDDLNAFEQFSAGEWNDHILPLITKHDLFLLQHFAEQVFDGELYSAFYTRRFPKGK